MPPSSCEYREPKPLRFEGIHMVYRTRRCVLSHIVISRLGQITHRAIRSSRTGTPGSWCCAENHQSVALLCSVMDKSRDQDSSSGPSAQPTQVLEQLNRSICTLQTLVEASPLAMIVVDRNGTVELWNRAAEQMFGWSEAEAVGHPLRISSDPMEPELPSSSGERIELICVRSDGKPLHVSSSVAPLRDDQGKIAGKVIILADITSRRESEQDRQDLVEREQVARTQARP